MLQEEASQKETPGISYAFSMFGTSIPINFMKTYAPILYIEQLGLAVSDFSLVLTISSILDILFVLLFGTVSDKYAKEMGRKSWLIFGSPLLSLSLIFFFNEPLLRGQNNLFAYVLIFYTLTILLDGMININYGALFPELFKKEKDRIKVNAYRQIFQLLAMILSIGLTPILVEEFSFTTVAVAYAIVSSIVIVTTATTYKEVKVKEEKVKDDRSETFKWTEVFSVLKNSLLIQYGLSTLSYSVAFSLLTQALPFFTRYSLEVDTSMNTYLFLVLFSMTILSIFFFKSNPLVFSSVDMWSLSFIVIGIGYFIVWLMGNLIGTFLGITVIGFGIGAMMTSSDIVGVLVIDYDYMKYKKLRTGKFMSVYNILFRANGIIVGFAYYIAEQFFGFVSGEQTTVVPNEAANFLFLYFPFLMIVFGVIMSQLFKRVNRNYEVDYEF